MARAKSSAIALQDLLDDFNLYDQYVDVVCAFEWLFTRVTEIADTVRHFERFPKIKVLMDDGTEVTVTPDFTVIFKDGTGLVGEISKLAMHDNSIDKACRQIGKYAELPHLPVDEAGTLVEVHDLDVLQLVPSDVGLAAVRRIIKDRYLNPDHEYAPPKAPVIAQYSRSADRDEYRYTFQHLPDPANGVLPNSDDPSTIGHFLTRVNNVTANRFNHIKARRKFMNDSVKPLYLATHLWTSHWPTEYGGPGTQPIEVTPADIAQTLRDQFGMGRASEVKSALALLARAGLAADNRDGTWTVSRATLRLRGERDIHRIIAIKASKNAKPVVQARSTRTARADETQQGMLF